MRPPKAKASDWPPEVRASFARTIRDQQKVGASPEQITDALLDGFGRFITQYAYERDGVLYLLNNYAEFTALGLPEEALHRRKTVGLYVSSRWRTKAGKHAESQRLRHEDPEHPDRPRIKYVPPGLQAPAFDRDAIEPTTEGDK